MEQVIKHYGNAIIAVLVLLGLAAIILVALSTDGVIATGFTDMIENFFDNMSSAATPTPTVPLT
jgi:hypothetical protein